MKNDQVTPKILYVITKANFGGAQRYVFNLAKEAHARGWNTAVVLGPRGALTEKLEKSNIETIPIPSLGRDINLLDEIRSFFSLLRIFHKEKPNIVHLNSSKIGGLGALAARLTGIKKIVFTAHGWPFLEELPSFNLALRKFFSWLTVLFSTHVIDISEKTREVGRALPFAHEKLYLIYNGVDPSMQFLSRAESRARLAHAIGKSESFFKGKTVLGTISELHRNKGLDHLLEALSEIKNLPFIFILIGEGEEREALEKLVEKYGLQDTVFLPGFIPDANQYLMGLDVFTLTSRKEGFPFALLEAGAAELPVIASNVGGISEILEDETGVLTQPGDTPTLTHALKTLIQNPLAREILGKNLKEKVSREFTLDAMLTNTFSLYKETTLHPEELRGVMVIVKNQRGQFLLHKRDSFTHHYPNQWSLIGGSCDANETFEETTRREVKEETGLSVLRVSKLEKVVRGNAESTLMYAEVNSQNEELKLTEGSEVRFFTREELEVHISQLPYSNPFLKALLRHLPHLS